jgi:hypothetical protein
MILDLIMLVLVLAAVAAAIGYARACHHLIEDDRQAPQ